MSGWGEIDPIVDAYGQLWWDAKLDNIFKSTYLGAPCIQHPGDAWVTQEIICETRPEVIVECGRLGGGSTIMWAHLLELLEIDGFVVSVELQDLPLEARAPHLEAASAGSERIEHGPRRRSPGSRTHRRASHDGDP